MSMAKPPGPMPLLWLRFTLDFGLKDAIEDHRSVSLYALYVYTHIYIYHIFIMCRCRYKGCTLNIE